MLELYDLFYIGVWSFIGSTIGFFALRDVPSPLIFKLKKWLLLISIGMFLAFPIATYLEESGLFSKKLSIMLAGASAMVIPDFALRYWYIITKKLAGIFLNGDTGKFLSNKKYDDNYSYQQYLEYNRDKKKDQE